MSTVHASFGASGAHRWLVCPASVRLQEGMPDTANEHAAEGTAAHELAEMALRSDKDCSAYLGMILHADGFEFEVDDDMAGYVQTYVDYVRALASAAHATRGGWTHIEHKFSLAKLRPPAPMFGTADATVYDGDSRTLYVIDLKYGRGKIVDPEDNPQLKYYGLGALLDMPKEQPVEKVVLVIAQPRAGGIKEWATDAVTLLDYAMDVIEAAKRALEPDAPAVAGDHCRWCKASAVCPALRGQALAVAQEEFGVLPKPDDLTPEQIAQILDKADVVEEWLSSIRAYAFRQAEAGQHIPGHKLVPRRAVRKWAGADEAEIARQLIEAGKGAVKDDDLFKKSLVSPAQAEKLVGKKNLPQGLIVAVSSGYSLVRDSDPRPKQDMLPPGHEFDTDR